MPKELLEIKNFNVGTIMSPDMKDIPAEAASYSLNLDSLTEDGKLQGLANDKNVTPPDFSGTAERITILNKDNPANYTVLVKVNNVWQALGGVSIG